MNVLAELHREPEMKLNLKFEIEVLCKNLGLDINVNGTDCSVLNLLLYYFSVLWTCHEFLLYHYYHLYNIVASCNSVWSIFLNCYGMLNKWAAGIRSLQHSVSHKTETYGLETKSTWSPNHASVTVSLRNAEATTNILLLHESKQWLLSSLHTAVDFDWSGKTHLCLCITQRSSNISMIRASCALGFNFH